MVHLYRNVFGHVPATRVRELSHMLKAILAQESRDALEKKANAIIDALRARKMSNAADLFGRPCTKACLQWLSGRSLAEDPGQRSIGAD
jgi:hypothetical protein